MKKVVFVLLASMLFLTSCNENKGNGNVVSEERIASGFHSITVAGVADINVHTGENYKVVVTTDDNLQDIILVEVKGNVLHVSQKRSTNFNPTRLIIDVHLPELQNISLVGVGNVELFSGNASNLEISLSGVGNINAQNYQVENINIKHSGVGDAKVWATNSLSGTLSGVGNILYKGSPAISVNVSGVGRVRAL
jgi:hypothetical protein